MEFSPDDDPEGRQDAGLYPVGRVLRESYDADNHDSLGQDLTGLMLELARIDPDAPAPPPRVMPVAPPIPVVIEPALATEPVAEATPDAPAIAPATQAARQSWWRAMMDRLIRH